MTRNPFLRHQLSILLALCIAPSMVRAGPVTVDTATKDQITAATELYEQGVIAFDAGKNDEAFALFSRSNDIVTSPNSRMMLGRTLAHLRRFPEAYRELSESIKLASASASSQKRYKKTAETAKHELDEVVSKLAFIKVRSAAKIQIQGQAVPDLLGEEIVPVTPGPIAVEVTFSNGRKTNRLLTLKPGEHVEFEVDAPIEPASAQSLPETHSQTSAAKDTPHPTGIRRKSLGYVFGTVGVVGVGTFVGFGLVGAGKYNNPKADCVQQLCPSSAVDNQGTRSLYQGIGYTGLAIGVLGIGAGTWLILSSSSGADSSTSFQAGPTGLKLTTRF